MQYLREAFASASVRSYLAGMVLCAHNIFLTGDMDPKSAEGLIAEAEEIIKTGSAKYPEGSVFHAIAGVVALGKI